MSDRASITGNVTTQSVGADGRAITSIKTSVVERDSATANVVPDSSQITSNVQPASSVQSNLITGGTAGVTGPTGATGATGPGVAAGGTTQQYLQKASDADYDTSWATLSKSSVNLGNVDNTSDASKPVSTATQTALDLKQDHSAVLDATTASFTTADETKLDGIEALAEVNNISDADATDLTDGGATTLHKHDHGGMDGLGDDDHAQYKKLSGRAGEAETFLGTGKTALAIPDTTTTTGLTIGTDTNLYRSAANTLKTDDALVVTGALTADGLAYPTADGTTGQFLKTDGAGNLSFDTPSGSGDMLASTYDAASVSEQLVGLTATQTMTNKTLTSPVINDTWAGWVSAAETWTYASVSAPTSTLTITGDKTTKYYAGMRLKLTQATGGTKYFIVTKAAYSAPNTTLTLYGGTDYALTNEAISSPFYSVAKAPAGFPLDPTKWTITTSNATERSTSSASLASLTDTLVVPIGAWEVSLQCQVAFTLGGSTGRTSQVILSTDGSTLTDADLVCKVSVTTASSGTTAFEQSVKKLVTLTGSTTYTLMGSVGNAAHTVLVSASTFAGGTKYLRAVSAYL